jgi:hypothetical protein
MWTLLKKLKLPLSIASTLIGILLGVKTLLEYWTPFNPLVGDIVITEARLPGDLVRELKSHTENIKNALKKDKDLWASPGIPDTFDRWDDDIGGVRWREDGSTRSSSVRQ